MSLKSKLAVLMIALASVGSGAAIAATQNTDSTTSAPTSNAPGLRHGYWRGHRGSAFVGTLLRATRQLNLSADQQQSIRSLVAQSRSQFKSNASGAKFDMTVLGNPAHPDYATAVQSAKSLAQSRLDREIELQGQIYNVLTSEQKTQLPQVLASMKATAQQRRSANS
ncbi:MAG TPA: Spy/CpxP family protein refolding chaperone [Steroidobacteraceae bacterium]|nr:Spy/CpxP family protein refolding chaperone [Steroidobacteraceae bacterium]